MNCRKIGKEQEIRAEQFLKENGYVIIHRNYSCRYGEIDLIAWKDMYLVFVEVKYRYDDKKGLPEEAVGAEKRRKLEMTAMYYMMKFGLGDETPCRFDVVAILGNTMNIIEDAFSFS